jgi:hypothetical protein
MSSTCTTWTALKGAGRFTVPGATRQTHGRAVNIRVLYASATTAFENAPCACNFQISSEIRQQMRSAPTPANHRDVTVSSGCR